MLVALSAAAELGYAVSAFQVIPFLLYPFLLLASSLVFIFFVPDKRQPPKESRPGPRTAGSEVGNRFFAARCRSCEGLSPLQHRPTPTRALRAVGLRRP